MSDMTFNGQTHTLTLTGQNGAALGSWTAYNNVDRHATLQHLSNGTYTFLDTTAPHPHPRGSPDGPYGSYGIFRFDVPGHRGIGVHSGRANAAHQPGPPHQTMGCIRTTDTAMEAIMGDVGDDPLATITVIDNDQVSAAQATRRHPH